MESHRTTDSILQGRRATRLRGLAGLALVAGWLGLAAYGSVRTLAYAMTPGRVAEAPPAWPRDSALPAPDGRSPLLLVFLHPQCPCSRATLAELARLLSESAAVPRVLAVVLAPGAAADGWLDTDVVRTARTLSGVAIHADEGGSEARRFGARVSGDTRLYSAEGALLFAGGLTAGRGHEGLAPGRVAVRDVLAGRVPARDHAPAFGCALQEGEAP